MLVLVTLGKVPHGSYRGTLPPETYAVVFFILGGVNFLMQLQFLALVELFFKQLNGYSF